MSQSSMTKSQLIKAVAKRSGISESSARNAFEAMIDLIAEELSRGGSVSVPGFARFSVQERPARDVRNPFDGTTISKPADRVAKVKLSKSFSKNLN